ncbi:hypothetical protein GCM10009678_64930 [Actinomadura kijaniata]
MPARRKPQRPGAYERISQDPRGLELGVNRQREDLESLADRLGWGAPTHYVENDTSASRGEAAPGLRPRVDRRGSAGTAGGG